MKRLYLFISLLLTGIFIAGPVLAAVATTSFETTDGSTVPTDGALIEGTGDGTGWSGNWILDSTGHVYDNAIAKPTGGGSWVAEMAGTRTLQRAYASTQAIGNQIVRLRRTGSGNSAGWTVRGNTTVVAWRLNIGQGAGTDIVVAGATTEICLTGFAADTWYKTEMEWDTGANTARCRVDDGAWSATVAREGGTGGVTHFSMLTDDSPRITYWDFFEDGAPVAAPVKDNNWFFLFPLTIWPFVPLPKQA